MELSRSKEPLSQAMDKKNDQKRVTEEYNENVQEMITEEPNEKGPHTLTSPAEDMEFSQDSNTGGENRTSFRTHTNVTTPDKKDHLEGQAEEEAPSYSGTEEFRKKATGEQPFLTEGEETTAPWCVCGNCEEDNAKELEKKTADLKQDRSNARSHNMNQYSNATMDDMADQEQAPYDKELPCSCGQSSSADETNAEIEEFETKA